MRDPGKLKKAKEEREAQILEAAYTIFQQYKIEGTSFQMVADKAHVGVATVFRYFPDKTDLVVRVSAWIWGQTLERILENRSLEDIKDFSAMERLSYTLDMYIDLYRNYKDVLVFNDNYNHYIVRQPTTTEEVDIYRLNPSDTVVGRIHAMYERAKVDHTVRTDLTEEQFLRMTLHTMMAACNHYAGGFIFGAKNQPDYTEDLKLVKDMIIRYVTP